MESKTSHNIKCGTESSINNNKKMHYCLGIEATADDFSVGIVSFDGDILANVISGYIPEKGGIHPREAARHHAKVAENVIIKAFQKAEVNLQEISVIAFSQGPGLGPCLRIGATASRTLALFLGVPLIGVNHCVAHIEIGKLVTGAQDPVTLYVSGGNTLISAYEASKYRVFGETLDIAVGNCFDVFAREAGLQQKEGMALGAMVERLAARSNTFVPLPYTVKGMDLSFSGLLTATKALLGKHPLEDLCFSLQEVAFSMLAEVTERALAHTEKSEILLTGGVAANNRLKQMFQVISEEHKANFFAVPKEYALDNGAMIAWTGVLTYQCGFETPIEKSFVRRKWRLDDFQVLW